VRFGVRFVAFPTGCKVSTGCEVSTGCGDTGGAGALGRVPGRVNRELLPAPVAAPVAAGAAAPNVAMCMVTGAVVTTGANPGSGWMTIRVTFTNPKACRPTALGVPDMELAVCNWGFGCYQARQKKITPTRGSGGLASPPPNGVLPSFTGHALACREAGVTRARHASSTPRAQQSSLRPGLRCGCFVC